jgi:hypothetical protein
MGKLRPERSPTLEELTAEGYEPRVVVLFSDDVAWPYEVGVERHFEPDVRQPWERIAAEFPGVTLTPLFHSPGPDAIRATVRRARARSPDYRPPNFLAWFAVDCPAGVDPDAVARRLAKLPRVRRAYVQSPPAAPPFVHPQDDPLFTRQQYLERGPKGVGVRSAWRHARGDGTGVRFVDVEQGWRLDHEDLPKRPHLPLHGESRYFMRHGTSVLGVVLAVDNSVGMVGIAPGVRAELVSEWYRLHLPPGSPRPARLVHSPAGAVLRAASLLEPGSVLLIESQLGTSLDGIYYGRPLECDEQALEAIRLATQLDIVVVEAAGNTADAQDGKQGFGDLDAADTWATLSRDDPDSGAILVAASKWHATSGRSLDGYHLRTSDSNYGTRVDCFAWGDGVVSLAMPEDPAEEGGALPAGYRDDFGGTSSAAAIIAGVAALVQGLLRAKRKPPLRPKEMRALLSDPELGTRALTAPPEEVGSKQDLHLGVMPDLAKIVPRLLFTR